MSTSLRVHRFGIVGYHYTSRVEQPGSGKILSLVMLYEIDKAERFPEVGNFLSYSRLVRCEHESVGKKKGSGGKKIGNAYFKWAFSEAACLMLRAMLEAKKWRQRQERKLANKKALSVLEAKIGRTVYHLIRVAIHGLQNEKTRENHAQGRKSMRFHRIFSLCPNCVSEKPRVYGTFHEL